MKQLHGVPNAKKLAMSNSDGAEVIVTDGTDMVLLYLENAPWGAGLSPQQARWIARQLVQSADRVEAGDTK